MEDSASVYVETSDGMVQTALSGTATVTRGPGVVCSTGKASIAGQGGQTVPATKDKTYTLIMTSNKVDSTLDSRAREREGRVTMHARLKQSHQPSGFVR